MKKIIETTICDECQKDITDKPYIEMDEESSGIWFGDIGRWINSKDRTFCSLKCFIKFLKDVHKRMDDAQNNDD